MGSLTDRPHSLTNPAKARLPIEYDFSLEAISKPHGTY